MNDSKEFYKLILRLGNELTNTEFRKYLVTTLKHRYPHEKTVDGVIQEDSEISNVIRRPRYFQNRRCKNGKYHPNAVNYIWRLRLQSSKILESANKRFPIPLPRQASTS